MITDKDLQDRFERLPKWAQDELNMRDHMIKSLTAAMRGEIVDPFVWVYELTARGGYTPTPLLGAESATMSKYVLIGGDPANAFCIDVCGNTLRVMGRNLSKNLVVKPLASNVVEISSMMER